ncbi:hypothetical protein LUD75_09325 [Epilithonimonas sp. JDS]|uniref:hypothetical protein n=1 Tax=Epilithonimonas sp. JDS TaxID=2902797 RepID=UPI001E3D3B93|nr:hypothetical protein [Epilithonimonas sp. JDS]MCD9854905.1 hypothetical protein [Epilithonimonas sp. JDS]
MENIKRNLANYLENADETVQQILFVPADIHPVWEDNAEILELAEQQILRPVGSLPDEQVFAFIGMHSKTLFTGKRDSIGFLITNFRILTQTDFSVIGTAELADVNPFTQKQDEDDLMIEVWNNFIKKNTLSIPHEQLAAIKTALQDVLEIVLPQLQQLNYLPNEIVKSNRINDRIRDLGLQSALKSYEQDEKKMAKFAEKYSISGIQFGMVDKPLFGGVYGLVITKTGIVSRDLMEDSFASSWQEIQINPAVIGEKKDNIVAGGKTHIVPSHCSEFVPSLIILLNELANGEVVI